MSNQSNQLIPDRLRAIREKRGMTMAEAARRLNLSKIGYSRYEYGDRAPSFQTVSLIAQCFGTSVDYLVGNTDNMLPDHLVVYKEDTPILFEIVHDLSYKDEAFLKRVRAYYRQLEDN